MVKLTFPDGTIKEVEKTLSNLKKSKVIEFIKKIEGETITFLKPRIPINRLRINHKELNQKKKNDLSKAKSMINFIEHKYRCRRQLILEYFNEISYEQCKSCDVCLPQSKEFIKLPF